MVVGEVGEEGAEVLARDGGDGFDGLDATGGEFEANAAAILGVFAAGEERAFDEALDLLAGGGGADAEAIREAAEVAAGAVVDEEEDAELGEGDAEVFPDLEAERVKQA